MCTPDYTAPETFLGRSVDPPSDIYALGIMAYRMLVGRLPFQHPQQLQQMKMHVQNPMLDVRASVADVPEDLYAFIERATLKQPQDRFASCLEAATLLGGGDANGASASLSIKLRFAPRNRDRVAEPLDAIRDLVEEFPWLSAEIEGDG